ncbi:MAG TPA: hypothetical protein VFR24_02095 [Candidatus Angelobacter sp.]|nr:hypothetical protein [Candidatus Angelobacter sp.]
MNKQVALITWAGLPLGAESEQLLLPLLAASGINARMVDWRDSSVAFSSFDLVVLRSCWDYHLHANEFTEWLLRTARVATILNKVDTVLWNSNKFYLRELEERGIQIAPTCFVASGEWIDRHHLQKIQNWTRVVAKPAVSASAHKTWVFDHRNFPSPEELGELMDGKDFLLQQFIPEIQTQGEISFVYIDGHYSHAVLKRPASGDFRVQQEHGGSAKLFSPSASLLQKANAIAQAVPQVWDSLYCRLDAVEKNGKLILMELELIEPELFLGLAQGAAERFATAIIRRLR